MREIIDAARLDAPLAGRVGGRGTRHSKRGERKPRGQRRIAAPPLCEPIQLPDAESHARRRDEHGTDGERYRPALHSASFSSRDRRLIAASRFSAALRSRAISW